MIFTNRILWPYKSRYIQHTQNVQHTLRIEYYLVSQKQHAYFHRIFLFIFQYKRELCKQANETTSDVVHRDQSLGLEAPRGQKNKVLVLVLVLTKSLVNFQDFYGFD